MFLYFESILPKHMSMQQLTFLVVDDLELMRAVTVNHLRSMGCEKIKVARNGVDALSMLRANKIDVLLSDWNMPVMTGLDLLRAVRADPKTATLPFLMITAETERQRIEEVINAGVSALLVKPFNAADLRARLERMVSTQPRPAASAPRALPARSASAAAASASSPDAMATDLALSPSRILVVDDFPGTLKLMVKMFEGEYEVATAEDGESALAACRVKPLPDLVLMDVMMPGMDGFEVVRRLRENHATAQIPVIFVSSLNEEEARSKGMALGAVDFVVKNSNPKVLRARVRNFIKFVDMRRQMQVDFDAMLDTAKRREDVENMARHDIKGSLAGIAGMVQSLADDGTMAPEHVAQLQLVAQTAQQLMSMVNLAGELYKIEAGQFSLNARAVDLGGLLHRVAALSRAGFADKQLVIEVDSDTPVGTEMPRAKGDEMLCNSLFQNLIKNACEAAPPNSRVVVTLKDETPLRVLINNTGAVPRDLRERFFEKYSTSGKPGGSGIGTYSASLLATAQHGSVTMDTNDQTNSTTLTVTLPRHDGAPTALT